MRRCPEFTEGRRCILILGGARSGKSDYAQRLAAEMGEEVLFVATAGVGDEEMRRRIQKHRSARSASWRSLEAETGLANKLAKEAGRAEVIIIDCITLLVSNLIGEAGEALDSSELEARVTAEIGALAEFMERSPACFIIVSNEVGLGLVPPNPLGRVYRDALGHANQMLARHADEVYMMFAGIPLKLKGEATP